MWYPPSAGPFNKEPPCSRFRVNLEQGGFMSQVIRRRWASDFAGMSKADRRSCEYDAYLPDELTGRSFLLDGGVAADVAEAEAAIARLNAEGLARILLRAEAVASSRIEGLDVGARRLLHAEAARSMGGAPGDVTAAE